MVHRRKSSHPVCKTRRNITSSNKEEIDNEEIAKKATSETDDDVELSQAEVSESIVPANAHEDEQETPIAESGVSAMSTANNVSDVAMGATESDKQQIVMPPDLFQDFEALRSETKMDAAELMRKLLKDFHNLTGSQSGVEEDNDSKKEMLSVDVASHKSGDQEFRHKTGTPLKSLDAEKDPNKYLELSKHKASRLEQLMPKITKKNHPEVVANSGQDQPLDLSVIPQSSTAVKKSADEGTEMTVMHKEEQTDAAGNSAVPMNVVAVQKNDNCMYVYPVCYPSVLFPQGVTPQGGAVPAPNAVAGVISPRTAQINSPESTVIPTSPAPVAVSTPVHVSPSQRQQVAVDTPLYSPETVSPRMVQPLSVPDDPRQRLPQQPEMQILEPEKESDARALPKYFRINENEKPEVKKEPGISQSGLAQSIPRYLRPSMKEGKGKSGEMKVVSENTSYTGFYTSVLKLPWSKRNRTKKAHLSKQTTGAKQIAPIQPNLQQQQSVQEQVQQQQQQQMMLLPVPTTDPNGVPSQAGVLVPGSLPVQAVPVSAPAPAFSQSCMMVYPNDGVTSLGKPVRKRGRPPKVPMLERLLQNSHGRKGRRPKKQEAATPVQVPQGQGQGQPSQMVLYPGQMVGAYGGIPIQQLQVATDGSQLVGQGQLQSPNIVGQAPAIYLQPQFAQGQLVLGQGQLQGQIQGQLQTVDGQPIDVAKELSQMQTDGQVSSDGTVTFTSNQPIILSPPASSAASPAQQELVTIKSEPGSTAKRRRTTADSSAHLVPGATRVMAHADTNTISTMSTTSIADTGDGSIYQEMILSSKSLVELKPRRRQTANQLLRAKAGDQNFLCTSFRIRPRLVAQAQAQRERLAAKCLEQIMDHEEQLDSDPKNLNGPQNDEDSHFGEIKKEVDMELSDGYPEYGLDEIHKGQLYIKEEPKDYDEPTEEEQSQMDKEEFPKLDRCNGNVKSSKNIANGKHFLDKEDSFDKIDYSDPSQIRYVLGDEILSRESSIGSSYGSPASVDSSLDEKMSKDMFQELFNCKVCNEIVPLEKKTEHWKKHAPVKLFCKSCGLEKRSFLNKDGSLSGDTMHCEKCNENFTEEESHTKSSLRLKGRSIICDDCDETFDTFTKFYEHTSEVHNKEWATSPEYTCRKCGKIYHNAHALQLHKKTHHECIFEDGDEHLLVKERRRGDNKQYYHCIYDGCPKRFLKNFHLQEHIRVKHFNIKAYQCPWPGCTKEFAAERHMKVHLLIHKDEKPISCEHCDYRCRQRSALNWHMRKHPEVPYKYKRYSNSPSNSAVESE